MEIQNISGADSVPSGFNARSEVQPETGREPTRSTPPPPPQPEAGKGGTVDTTA